MANDIHREFVVESREHLQVFERSLLALERAYSPQQVCECIDASLRAMHSLKGNAGFLGFHTVQELAHATESVLENYRNQTVAPPVFVVEAILLANDRLGAMIDDLEHSRTQDISSLLKTLRSFDVDTASIGTESKQRRAELTLNLPVPPATILPLFKVLDGVDSRYEAQLPTQDLQVNVDHWQVSQIRLTATIPSIRSAIGLRHQLSQVGQSIPWNAWGAIELDDLDTETLEMQLSSQEGELVYEPVDLREGLPTQPVLWFTRNLHKQTSPAESKPSVPELAITPPTPSVAKSVVADSPMRTPEVLTTSIAGQASTDATSDRPNSLRIQVDLLDRLMNLVSELTLVRNQSLLAFGDADGAPQAVIQRLNSVTSGLQETVLKTRMQPVGSLFGRFPRMVRDLARQLGKQVELVLVGQEVELDKTVLEQLSDPLTHLIRNSVDHGLETPDERLKHGKPVVGQVTLSALAADGQVIIEIRDDGRGIDPDAVRAKVIARGIKTESELQKISSKELYSYILLPGFSTAKQVSDVSGRGVGMDVVKTNVERLEGSLTIDSSPGLGTTMTLRVPLTLAIIPCLIVTVGENRFAVPQRGLEEIVCLHPGGRGSIEHSYDTELFRLRDVLLPIVRLDCVLQCNTPFTANTKAEIMTAHAPALREPDLIEYILVLRTGGRKFGLLVDDVRGTEEVVVKPMHPSLKKIGIFAGATLMGDGRVALIANIDGIAEHARCYGVEPPKIADMTKRNPTDVHRILLFEYGPKEQFAVPLVQVRRVESISMHQVEVVGEQSFITIDGVVTRIIQLDKHLKVSACEWLPTMHLILPKFVSEPIGILVSRIVDTESLSITLQDASIEDPGILGTAIVGGRLSLFLDTQYLRERLFGLRSEAHDPLRLHSDRSDASKKATSGHAQQSTGRHVLLVDDTPFFREVVKRYFERENLVVTTAVDGNDGLNQLTEKAFDLVVSDIEMPNRDGWDFCMEARKRGITTPFLALTSLSKQAHATKASECGFDGFEEKLDHDRLMVAVLSMLGIHRKEVPNGR